MGYNGLEKLVEEDDKTRFKSGGINKSLSCINSKIAITIMKCSVNKNQLERVSIKSTITFHLRLIKTVKNKENLSTSVKDLRAHNTLGGSETVVLSLAFLFMFMFYVVDNVW